MDRITFCRQRCDLVWFLITYFQDIWREDVVSLTIIDITTTIFIKDITTTPNLEEDVPLYASFERGSNSHGALNSGRYVKHRT